MGKKKSNGCDNKMQHADPMDALVAGMEMSKLLGESVWPYKCGVCKLWHNGHVNIAVRRFIHFYLGLPVAEMKDHTRLTSSMADQLREAPAKQ